MDIVNPFSDKKWREALTDIQNMMIVIF